MKRNSILKILALAFSTTFVTSSAAFDCKGLSETQCKNNDDCYWVKGYNSISGKFVEGYCTAKPMKRKRISIDREETERPNTLFSGTTTKSSSRQADQSNAVVCSAQNYAIKYPYPY